MKGVRGCFVCGQEQSTRAIDYKEEVKVVINKLKLKNNQSLLSKEVVSTVVNMTIQDEDEDEEKDDDLRWLLGEEEEGNKFI